MLIYRLDVLCSDPTNFIHFKEPNRTHYRVLLQSFGYSLTDFLSQEELLTVFIDVINGGQSDKLIGYSTDSTSGYRTQTHG